MAIVKFVCFFGVISICAVVAGNIQSIVISPEHFATEGKDGDVPDDGPVVRMEVSKEETRETSPEMLPQEGEKYTVMVDEKKELHEEPPGETAPVVDATPGESEHKGIADQTVRDDIHAPAAPVLGGYDAGFADTSLQVETATSEFQHDATETIAPEIAESTSKVVSVKSNKDGEGVLTDASPIPSCKDLSPHPAEPVQDVEKVAGNEAIVDVKREYNDDEPPPPHETAAVIDPVTSSQESIGKRDVITKKAATTGPLGIVEEPVNHGTPVPDTPDQSVAHKEGIALLDRHRNSLQENENSGAAEKYVVSDGTIGKVEDSFDIQEEPIDPLPQIEKTVLDIKTHGSNEDLSVTTETQHTEIPVEAEVISDSENSGQVKDESILIETRTGSNALESQGGVKIEGTVEDISNLLSDRDAQPVVTESIEVDAPIEPEEEAVKLTDAPVEKEPHVPVRTDEASSNYIPEGDNGGYRYGSICSYCKFCKLCALCRKCPSCKEDKTRGHCEICKYCKYCNLCDYLCVTICNPGGFLDSFSGFIYSALPNFSKQMKEEADKDIDKSKDFIKEYL